MRNNLFIFNKTRQKGVLLLAFNILEQLLYLLVHLI